jgi:hypothetical protein
MELVKSALTPLRALVTECSPYELPLEMAGHWLYDWLDHRAISVTPEALKIVARTRFDLLVLAVIGDVRFEQSMRHGEPVIAQLDGFSSTWRAPASFRVRRDRSRTRELELLSIRSQLNIGFLYYRQKDMLLHYSNRDRSSLRHPARVNVYGKSQSSKFRPGKASHLVTVETTARTINTYNSYFVYDKYAFVGQFYDSREWLALEARWRFLRRLDVANCFRSIYTHSASWSTGTDFFSKQHLGGSGEYQDLGQILDQTMQSANWGETHGICVGPEASRVFAEIVFQHLGSEIEARVKALGIEHRDYEILRYVDDYFVFSNEQTTVAVVSRVIEDVLADHKFSINRSKTRDYSTPFTTPISVKKADLQSFLRTALPYDEELPKLNAREISVHLKAFLVGAEDESATVGTSLSQIEKRLLKFLRRQASRCRTKEEAQVLLAYVRNFVYDMLFLYLSHPSVASSMKVVRALRMYFQSPDLFTLPERDRAGLRFRTDEFVHFGITKAIERLADIDGAEIELCHFLSLAGACGVGVDHSSKLTMSLVAKVSLDLPRAKGNQASIFLLLAVVKLYLSQPACSPALREQLVSLCQRTAQHLLARSYLPGGKVRRHAAQETFMLAISTCPYMGNTEKTLILSQPWLLDLIGSEIFGGQGSEAASARFLRRCLVEYGNLPNPVASAGPLVFNWNNEQFDRLLYEKQPQFLY